MNSKVTNDKAGLVAKWSSSCCRAIARKDSGFLSLRLRADGSQFAVVKTDSMGSVTEVIEEINSTKTEVAKKSFKMQANQLGFSIDENCTNCPFGA